MSTTLADLARLVNGALLGDGEVPIHGAAPLADAGPGEITLIDRPEKVGLLVETPAAAAVVPVDTPAGPRGLIAVDDVHAAFTAIVSHFRPARPLPRIGVSPQAIVAPSAELGDGVDVHPGATIGPGARIGRGSTIHSGAHIQADCFLGEGVTIMPGAVLYENTLVGPRTIIHSGAVIGAHGFGYRTTDGEHLPGAQLGHVEIGADVEIGAGTTIDRGTYGPTRIGEGTKIDNLVMIAHNCRIGRHNMICSQVGIAGSSTTGDYVVMAGQVGVGDHVHIGSRVVLGAKAGVSNDVPDGACLLGAPATPIRQQKLQFAAVARLPEMRKQFKAVQQIVDRLAALHELDEPNAAA